MLAEIAAAWLAVALAPGTLFSHPEVAAFEGAGPVGFEAGVLYVPENRARAHGRLVSIPWYRFRSTAAATLSPVFVLAGGPGESALKDFADDAEFRAMVLFLREITDVVLLDQRGAGRSRPLLDCPYAMALPEDRPLTQADHVRELRKQAMRCRDEWQRLGVDLAAYNTLENAADVDALRAALGYPRISLFAGSYGTHLSFAIMRRFPKSVDRAILYGIEGPDHTWDMPSETLESLSRIAAAAEASAALRGFIPEGGLLAALERVGQRLEREPAEVSITHDGEPTRVVVSRFDIQRLARHGAHDRTDLAWPAHIIAMDRGDFAPAAKALIEARAWPIDSAMYFMMDCASGISPRRRARLESDPAEQRARAILGDLNLTYAAACDIWNAPDLGEGFRENLVTDIPALIFQGTWDVSTPPENATEIAGGFSRGALVSVEGGSHFTLHDLFASWPPIRKLLAGFLRGERVDAPPRITLPEAVFRAPAQEKP